MNFEEWSGKIGSDNIPAKLAWEACKDEILRIIEGSYVNNCCNETEMDLVHAEELIKTIESKV